MHMQQISEKIFLIDVKTNGFENFMSSYVLKGEKAIIVDCGPDSSVHNLLTGLNELGIQREEIEYVALTHVHIDHSGGTGALLQSLPNAKVIVHPRGAPHLIEPARLWKASKETLGNVADIYGEPKPVAIDRIITTHESMILDVEDEAQLKIIESLGHAAHSVSYFDIDSKGLFPGDAAGAYFSKLDTLLPTSPPPFRPDIALSTLEKFINLNPKFLYYPHFGVVSDAVKRLQTHIDQIKLWLNIAQDGVKKGESIETLRTRFYNEDTTIREEIREKLLTEIRNNSIHKKSLITNSTDGFIDFVRKTAYKMA